MRLSQMGRQGRLAGYVEQLPKTYEAEGSVGCSWKEMGRVMRSLVETERSEVEAVKALLEEQMKGAADLKGALEGDAKVGDSWFAAK